MPGRAGFGEVSGWLRVEDGRCVLPVSVPGEYQAHLHGEGVELETAPASFVVRGKAGERVRLRFDRASYERERAGERKK